MQITRMTTVVEALKISDSVKEILKKYDLECAACKGAGQDSVERVAVNNGLDPDAFVKELNAAVKKG